MNWYDKSQFNLDAITQEQWQEINDRMVAIGYNWRGWEDAKSLFYKLQHVLPEDHKKVMDAVVNKNEYIKKNDPQKTRKIFDKATRHFGITFSLKEAGYILPNGTLLDLSGKKWGNHGNTRGLDHSEINEITNMKDFIEMGAIRHFPEQPGIDIRTKPTKKQLDIIQSEVDQSSSGYIVEIFNYKKGRFYNQYDVATKGTKVINDILRFYSDTVSALSKTWYKMSKLIDKDPHPENYMIVQCSKCNRYATENPSNPKEPIWKALQDMDAQEKQEIAESEKPNNKTRISHGVCPVCYDFYLKDIEEYMKTNQPSKNK